MVNGDAGELRAVNTECIDRVGSEAVGEKRWDSVRVCLVRERRVLDIMLGVWDAGGQILRKWTGEFVEAVIGECK